MNVHITNIYGFIQDQELKKKQNQFADAGHALGIKMKVWWEMSFNYIGVF